MAVAGILNFHNLIVIQLNGICCNDRLMLRVGRQLSDLGFVDFNLYVLSAWADSSLAELAYQLGSGYHGGTFSNIVISLLETAWGDKVGPQGWVKKERRYSSF